MKIIITEKQYNKIISEQVPDAKKLVTEFCVNSRLEKYTKNLDFNSLFSILKSKTQEILELMKNKDVKLGDFESVMKGLDEKLKENNLSTEMVRKIFEDCGIESPI